MQHAAGFEVLRRLFEATSNKFEFAALQGAGMACAPIPTISSVRRSAAFLGFAYMQSTWQRRAERGQKFGD